MNKKNDECGVRHTYLGVTLNVTGSLPSYLIQV